MKHLSLFLIIFLFFSCKQETSKTLAVKDELTSENNNQKEQAQPLSEEFRNYWYAGEAEITSYKLEQARYGELREGTSVLVFVTEPFENELQVKADYKNSTNIPVLKLNATKNYNTGIYPYSIMQSTFYPVANNKHAIKVSCSVQEWCGHVYSQLNNRDAFEFISHSYFQSEADQNLKLEKAILENELWNQLRINPTSLPTGELSIIPSLEFIRLKHVPIKAYNATAILTSNSYSISYPELERTLSISFDSEFPFTISGWTESFKSGFGANAKVLTSKATKLKTLKSAYWGKNSNADESLRKTLLLK